VRRKPLGRPTRSPVKLRRNELMFLFASCLFAPVVLGFLRKFVPGQPSWVRAASLGVVFVVAMLSFRDSRRTPTWITGPLLLWAGLQLIYTVPAGLSYPLMLPLIMVVYFVPLLLTRVAYISVNDTEVLSKIALWFGYLGVVMLPLGLIVAIFGNDALPFWLGPTEAAIAQGLGNMRGQFPAPSLVESAPVAFGHVMLAINILLLVGLELSQQRGEKVGKWWLLIALNLILNYLTGRRGIFLGSMIGVTYSLLRGKKYRFQKLVGVGLFALGVVLIDQYGSILWGLEGRSDIYETMEFQGRLQGIFWRFTSTWLDLAPFGNFVGYSSPFSGIFGVRWPFVIEVGAASLVADMGILGLVVFPIVTALLVAQLLLKSKGLRCRPAVIQLVIAQLVIFVLYYFKAAAFLTICTTDHLLFWTMPGIGAALIVNERRQRQVVRAQQKGGSDKRPSSSEASSSDTSR
jgi:hypothetical protein